MRKIIWFWILMLCSCSEATVSTNISLSTNPLFQSVPSSHSGITFNNKLTENLQTGENILDFDFFFNGAGVAIADFDNDGLEDIFFAGNQVQNRIYRNEGALKFADKSASSGINTPNKFWSNGVSCADVNQDGFLDIYISQGGPYGPEKRGNLLLINNGDFTFSEQGAKYGLNDNGISTQSAFFDYDKDGDLDCFVMNESPLIGLDPVSFYSLIKTHSATLLPASSSHLYKNENGKFVDVSDEAGVLLPSFGLGLCISDINNDNWLDIYVANDYYIPDAIYINDKKGGFTNETKNTVNQSSFYSMGVDIADINKDGHQDMYVLDMASIDHVKSKTLMASMNVANFDLLTKDFNFPYQYMFNTLQLNNTQNHFNNIAHISGTSKTDWSWSCLIEDFNQNGHKEIFVTNGYKKYARDNDFQNNVNTLKAKYNNQEIPLEEKEKIYKTIPSEKLSNVFFEQKSSLQFKNSASHQGLNETSFSNGASYADLDNDGDMDLVVNNIDEEAFLYENKSELNGFNYLRIKLTGPQSENFAKVKIYHQSQMQMAESKRVRGYLSSLPNDIYFGLAKADKIDSLIVTWQNGKSQKILNIKANQILNLDHKNALEVNLNNSNASKKFSTTTSILPAYKHNENGYNDFNLETLLPYKQSVTGPNLQLVDKSSIFIGGAAKQESHAYSIGQTKQTNLGSAMADISKAVFFDIDQDGDQDAYLIASGNEYEATSNNYQDHIYYNENGQYKKATNQGNLNPQSSGKTGLPIDFDKDGDDDLIICNRIIPKKYPAHAPSILFENRKGKLIDVTKDKAPELSSFGIINDIEALDFNNDGWIDFIVVGEWTGVGLFQNNEGHFENVSNKYGLDKALGWWFSITPTDMNSDGKSDYIIGNLGLNSKYKASPEKPLLIYGHDFDNNGSYDQVLSYTYKGKEVPLRGRQCSSEQMPFIQDKFKTYDAFANATMEDVYGEGLKEATLKKATMFSSMVLISTPDGFSLTALPTEAQFRPVLDGISLDIDKNGFQDLILIGNIYETEVETPRLDYSDATILLSDGVSYTFSAHLSASLRIDGNSKSIVLIKDNSQNKVLIGVNNEAVREYSIKD